MEMTDALKSYVQERLAKVKAHFDRVIDVDVVLSVEKHRQIVEMTLHVNGVHIHGKEALTDMYSAIDAVVEKLDKQILRYKNRVNRHQPLSAKEAGVLQPRDEPELEEPSEDAGTNGSRQIVRERLAMKPMSVEEASLQLGLSNDAFLVFSNAATQQINVIYARDDGSLGLIEPQF